jgi:anti-sigma B factor antagonist
VGWQRDVTFEDLFPSEVAMSSQLGLSDSTSNSADVAAPPFGCTLGEGGRGAAWVRVAGELDRATAPQLAQTLAQAARRARVVVVDLRGLTRVDSTGVGAIADASRSARADGRRLVLVRGLSQVERLLALTGALGSVEIVDLTAGEPPILALLQIARNDRVDTRQRARATRRVATLLGANQITRSVDAFIARGIRHDFIDG